MGCGKSRVSCIRSVNYHIWHIVPQPQPCCNAGCGSLGYAGCGGLGYAGYGGLGYAGCDNLALGSGLAGCGGLGYAGCNGGLY